MEASLKDRLADALQYPKMLIRNELNLENCTNNGLFNTDDRSCLECEDRDTCTWVLSMEEKADFVQVPLDKLVIALGFALESIQAVLQDNEHDPFCRCEACQWQKLADQLYSEARCHPELGPPPQPH